MKEDVVVAGLSEHSPSIKEEVLQLLEEGNERRSQAPTDANAESSRSHAIFQVIVRQNRTEGVTSAVNTGKLSLIDLAGSERAARMKNQGQRLVELNLLLIILVAGNPQDVVDAYVHAILSVSPNRSYAIGWDSLFVWILQTFFPEIVIDFVLTSLLKP